MKILTQYSRILILATFSSITFLAYAASQKGWYAAPFKDHQTMTEIKEKCPDYYQNTNGDCLRTTFRSIWFQRASSGSGGFGAGK